MDRGMQTEDLMLILGVVAVTGFICGLILGWVICDNRHFRRAYPPATPGQIKRAERRNRKALRDSLKRKTVHKDMW